MKGLESSPSPVLWAGRESKEVWAQSWQGTSLSPSVAREDKSYAERAGSKASREEGGAGKARPAFVSQLPGARGLLPHLLPWNLGHLCFGGLCKVCPGWAGPPWLLALQIILLLFSRSVVSSSLQPMKCSTPGFPVLHYLLKLAQTHVHRASDAIQPSHSLFPPFPPALNLSQHQVCNLWSGFWLNFSPCSSSKTSAILATEQWFTFLGLEASLLGRSLGACSTSVLPWWKWGDLWEEWGGKCETGFAFKWIIKKHWLWADMVKAGRCFYGMEVGALQLGFKSQLYLCQLVPWVSDSTLNFPSVS